MILSERITALIDYTGLSIPKFAMLVGFKTPQAVRELLKGRTKTLSEAAQHKILQALPDVNPDWLLTGQGDMLLPTAPDNDGHNPTPAGNAMVRANVDTSNITLVPLIHIDSVGGIHSGNDINSPEYVERLIPMTGARQGDIAIYQSGTSMAPAIPSGALLLIREVEEWRDYIGYGDVFVLLLSDDRRITKEVRRYDPDPQNFYWCVSYNPDVADEELPKRLVRRVWKVIKVLIDKGW